MSISAMLVVIAVWGVFIAVALGIKWLIEWDVKRGIRKRRKKLSSWDVY